METRGSSSRFDKVLTVLGLSEKSAVNFEKFCSICAELFSSNEIEQRGGTIKEIFDLFDRDRDGILKGQELKL